MAVSARLLNAINKPQPVLVSFTVTAPGGTPVFTSNPVGVTLSVQTALTNATLGNLDTTGFAPGDYSIDVTATDPLGTPLLGGTGRGADRGWPSAREAHILGATNEPGTHGVPVAVDIAA